MRKIVLLWIMAALTVGHGLWERGESRSRNRIRVRSEIVLRICD